MDSIDLTDGNTKGRAEQAMPGGYNAHRITEPPTDVAWEDVRTYVPEDPADLPCVLPQRVVEGIATSLAQMEFAADMVTARGKPEANAVLAGAVSSEARRLRLILRQFLGGAAVLALAVVAVVAAPAGRAEAVEAPQPDPVTARVVAQPSVAVVLDRAVVTVRVRVTTAHVTPAGKFCASLWAPTSYGQGFIGRTCAARPTFTVTGALDARYVPVGRSRIAVTDDVSPLDTIPATVTLVARRLSRFGTGTWVPTYYGDGLTVTAPLYAYTPAVGAWTPQKSSPVQVQELRAGRWVTVATLTTNSWGVASGSVVLGGGLHTVRVARPAGVTVTATVGTAHTFYLVPTDVPVDVI